MLESIKQYAEALSGLTEVPRQRARRIATSLSKQGVIPTGQIRSVATNIVERSRENRHRLTELVTTQLRKQAGAIGLATSDEIERLRRRVIALEGGKPAAPGKSAARPASKAKPRKATGKAGSRAAAAARKPRKVARKKTATRKRASTARRR